jgi:Putative zinc-finger
MAELELQCHDVLTLLLVYIDNEIADPNQQSAIEIHIQECEPCHHTYEIELNTVLQLQNLLRAACNEIPGLHLHQQIIDQTQALWQTMNSNPGPMTTYQFTSETTYFSTDGVSFHHIQIEHHEIHHIDDEESNS